MTDIINAFSVKLNRPAFKVKIKAIIITKKNQNLNINSALKFIRISIITIAKKKAITIERIFALGFVSCGGSKPRGKLYDV